MGQRFQTIGVNLAVSGPVGWVERNGKRRRGCAKYA